MLPLEKSGFVYTGGFYGNCTANKKWWHHNSQASKTLTVVKKTGFAVSPL